MISYEEFDELVERRCALIKTILVSKGREYSADGNRFHNFYAAADLTADESPERALLGMWKKHLVSVLDIINQCDTHDPDTAIPGLLRSYVDEKIGDLINYAILLEGMLQSRLDHSYKLAAMPCPPGVRSCEYCAEVGNNCKYANPVTTGVNVEERPHFTGIPAIWPESGNPAK